MKKYIFVALVTFSSFTSSYAKAATTQISLTSYGADPTGKSYSDEAFNKFFEAVKQSGRGHIPAGRYVFAKPLNFDLSTVAEKGITLEGDGMNNTILDVSQVKSSPQAFIGSKEGKAIFYSKFTDFAIAGNTPHTVLMLGKHDLQDQLNEFIMSLNVTNANTSKSPQANPIEINANYNGNYRFVANIGGIGIGGDVLRCRQCQFTTFSGSYGNGTTSFHLTDGYSYGNVFLSPDFERTHYGVVIDSAKAVNNIFLGGQWENTIHAVDATAGNNNTLLNPNFAYAQPVGKGIGIHINTYQNDALSNIVSQYK